MVSDRASRPSPASSLLAALGKPSPVRDKGTSGVTVAPLSAPRNLPTRTGLTIHSSRDPKMYVLETRQLRKSFGEGDARVEALRGVDLGIKQGEMLAIMGRSGSGKSTLLTLLGGVDVPTSGQVLL